jgi:arginyl-tRNA synthetase
VSKQPTKGITFKWEEALDFDAQSAPYVQYVHARCCGILQDAPEINTVDPETLVKPEEQALLKTIAAFPAEVDDAADSLTPHQIATYTRTISEVFNTFYRECPVLTADDPAVRDSRIALVIATKNTVANALDILGVDAPEVM